MKAEDFTLILIIAVFLSFVPPHVSSQKRTIPEVPSTPFISPETARKETLLLEKQAKEDSLYRSMDRSVEIIKTANSDIKYSAKIIDNTDLRLTRSIAALKPKGVDIRVDLLEPNIPHYAPLPLPEVSYEKEKANIFKRIFNWFR